MQEKIEYRKLVIREETLEVMEEAGAYGDLSENFEYKVVRQNKNRDESRTRYLEKMIKTAKIISDSSREGEVGLGDTAEVYIPDNDETEQYKLVTTVRSNSFQGLIGIGSPLGKTTGGRKAGDRVYIKANDRFGYGVEIRPIDKITEGEEDKLRSY